MKISQLARAAAVNVETIRYYTRRGLISQPVRPDQGVRNYPEETLERVVFIKGAKELGFSLQEIANLLSLGEEDCLSVQQVAQQKLANVKAKIADLNRLETVLEELVTQCAGNTSKLSCPIVDTLIKKLSR